MFVQQWFVSRQSVTHHCEMPDYRLRLASTLLQRHVKVCVRYNSHIKTYNIIDITINMQDYYG